MKLMYPFVTYTLGSFMNCLFYSIDLLFLIYFQVNTIMILLQWLMTVHLSLSLDF